MNNAKHLRTEIARENSIILEYKAFFVLHKIALHIKREVYKEIFEK